MHVVMRTWTRVLLCHVTVGCSLRAVPAFEASVNSGSRGPDVVSKHPQGPCHSRRSGLTPAAA